MHFIIAYHANIVNSGFYRIGAIAIATTPISLYSISFLLYSPCTSKTTGNRLQDYSWVIFFLVYDKGVIHHLHGTSKKVIEIK